MVSCWPTGQAATRALSAVVGFLHDKINTAAVSAFDGHDGHDGGDDDAAKKMGKEGGRGRSCQFRWLSCVIQSQSCALEWVHYYHRCSLCPLKC